MDNKLNFNLSQVKEQDASIYEKRRIADMLTQLEEMPEKERVSLIEQNGHKWLARALASFGPENLLTEQVVEKILTHPTLKVYLARNPNLSSDTEGMIARFAVDERLRKGAERGTLLAVLEQSDYPFELVVQELLKSFRSIRDEDSKMRKECISSLLQAQRGVDGDILWAVFQGLDESSPFYIEAALHPKADLRIWQKIAETREGLEALLHVGGARVHPEIRKKLATLVGTDVWRALAREATGEEFRMYFKKLAAVSPDMAAAVLEHSTRGQQAVLEAEEIATVLSRCESKKRIKAVLSLGAENMEMLLVQETGKRDQDKERGKSIRR